MSFSREAASAWEGRVIGEQFVLRQWLGGSDHSAVFAADWNQQPSSPVVIKFIAPAAEHSETKIARLRTASQLSHPHLIRIFEAGRCTLNDVPLVYLAMEKADEDLAQSLPLRSLTPAEVADLLPPVLDALAYLHEKGFVHGRVKPSNLHAVGDQVKLSADSIISVSDLGAGRRRQDVYDAPETAAGVESPAGDVWSLGVTLVAALTQRTPPDDEAKPNIDGLLATVPEPFGGIARECLQLDPQRRCSLSDIGARLVPSPSAAPPAPEPAAPVTRTTADRNSMPVRVFVAIAALVLLAVIFALWKRGSSSSPAVAGPTTPQAATTQTPLTPPLQSAKNSSASRGHVIRQVLPDISPSARQTVTGTLKVKIRVDVNSTGKVTKAALASHTESKYFVTHSLSAAQEWEFSPPEINGQPSNSSWLLEFRFQRSGTHATAQQVRR